MTSQSQYPVPVHLEYSGVGLFSLQQRIQELQWPDHSADDQTTWLIEPSSAAFIDHAHPQDIIDLVIAADPASTTAETTMRAVSASLYRKRKSVLAKTDHPDHAEVLLVNISVAVDLSRSDDAHDRVAQPVAALITTQRENLEAQRQAEVDRKRQRRAALRQQLEQLDAELGDDA